MIINVILNTRVRSIRKKVYLILCIQLNGISIRFSQFEEISIFTIIPTDRPKSVSNRCVIKVLVALVMLSRCFLDFSVGVRAFVIGLNQISSFFSYSFSFWLFFHHDVYMDEIVYEIVNVKSAYEISRMFIDIMKLHPRRICSFAQYGIYKGYSNHYICCNHRCRSPTPLSLTRHTNSVYNWYV